MVGVCFAQRELACNNPKSSFVEMEVIVRNIY